MPLTQLHFPTLPHRDFAGRSGAGEVGDANSWMRGPVRKMIRAFQESLVEFPPIPAGAPDGFVPRRRAE